MTDRLVEKTHNSAWQVPMRGNRSSGMASDAYRWNRNSLNPPIEVRLYHAGECAGTGKIRTIGPHGMFVETTGAFAKDMYGMYLQVHFVLPDEQEDSRFYLDGRVIHSLDTGVVLLMDVLHPITSKGLASLLEQATTRASVVH